MAESTTYPTGSIASKLNVEVCRSAADTSEVTDFVRKGSWNELRLPRLGLGRCRQAKDRVDHALQEHFPLHIERVVT